MPNVKIPPNLQQAVLKKIYPWDEYNITLVTHWLYLQAQKTGFVGTFEDFKLRYGSYIATTDPQEIEQLIEKYKGSYHVIPQVNVDQILRTENTILEENVVVEKIPYVQTSNEAGGYTVTIG